MLPTGPKASRVSQRHRFLQKNHQRAPFLQSILNSLEKYRTQLLAHYRRSHWQYLHIALKRRPDCHVLFDEPRHTEHKTDNDGGCHI